MSNEQKEKRQPILAHEWDYGPSTKLRAIVKGSGRVSLEAFHVDGLGTPSWQDWREASAAMEYDALQQAIEGMALAMLREGGRARLDWEDEAAKRNISTLDEIAAAVGKDREKETTLEAVQRVVRERDRNKQLPGLADLMAECEKLRTTARAFQEENESLRADIEAANASLQSGKQVEENLRAELLRNLPGGENGNTSDLLRQQLEERTIELKAAKAALQFVANHDADNGTMRPLRRWPFPHETAPLVLPGVDTREWWQRKAEYAGQADVPDHRPAVADGTFVQYRREGGLVTFDMLPPAMKLTLRPPAADPLAANGRLPLRQPKAEPRTRISEAEAREAATMKAQGMGWPAIAETLGRSAGPLRRAVMQLGKARPRRRGWPDGATDALRQAMRDSSESLDDGRPAQWVAWAKNYAWKCKLHPHTVACKVRAILKEAATKTETGDETK